jgi:hypothetical protein
MPQYPSDDRLDSLVDRTALAEVFLEMIDTPTPTGDREPFA